MAVCCCSLAGTAACQHCASNPFATDVWTNKTVTVGHIDAKPFGNGLDVCPVCGKPTTIGNPKTKADLIRAMTDEELAAKIEELCQYAFMQISVYSKPMGKAEWLEWLKQEVET